MDDIKDQNSVATKEKSPALRKAEAYFGEQYPLVLQLGGRTAGGLPPKVVHRLMEGVEMLTKDNYKGITSAQIRKVFGIFKDLEVAEPLAMVKLKYKLDYLLARQRNDPQAAVIIALIKDMIDRIATMEAGEGQGVAIESFFTVMEAIVAYHKYYEEKNSSKGK